jgi:hypothetical protein
MDEYVTAHWQIAFVVAIALGAGLFSFGGYLEPPLDFSNSGEMARLFQQHGRSEEHYIASTARGFGIGLMTLGGLGLLVPWINVLLGRLVGRDSGEPEHDAPGKPGG